MQYLDELFANPLVYVGGKKELLTVRVFLPRTELQTKLTEQLSSPARTEIEKKIICQHSWTDGRTYKDVLTTGYMSSFMLVVV